jgi:hypothetical protein
MAKEYFLWDKAAAEQIELKELDKHFLDNRSYYTDTVKKLWAILCDCNERPKYLKPGDLYDTLVPAFQRDSKLESAFMDRGLPYSGERGARKWISWFTHYVVEQCYPELGKEG